MHRNERERRAVGRRAVLGGVLAAVGIGTVGASVTDKLWTAPSHRANLAYRGWSTGSDLAAGSLSGARMAGDTAVFSRSVGTMRHEDVDYEYATWTSPDVHPGFGTTEIIVSWTADTPGASWTQLELQGITRSGQTTQWYNLGRWAAGDDQIRRASVTGQQDQHGTVVVDAFVAADGVRLVAYRLRAKLLRPVGGGDKPALRSLGAVAGLVSDRGGQIVPSVPKFALGKVLDVPRYSQNLHIGQYEQWGGGGAAWCSPTSTSMVLAYWRTGPRPEDYAWVMPTPDPWIDYAARNTYDYSYGGTGNWAFNTAYAGRYGVNAFVTRLRSLNEAESFIAAGIPLVLSIAFNKGEVPGLTYSTDGHLLTLVGFTDTGDPVLNDPASPTDEAVRKIVGRNQFESHWLRLGGGGAYVIHPAAVALPPRPPQANW